MILIIICILISVSVQATCPPGFSNATGSCSGCAEGQYTASVTAVCKACETGKFQELSASTEYNCKFCAAGTKFTATNTACTNCIGGQYQEQNTLASAACKTCEAGQYTVSKTAVCKACEVGKFQELSASIEYNCKFCAAGTKFTAKTTACANCVDGQYQEQNTLASAVCKQCPIGQYAANITAECQACETGKFQELAASIEYNCKFCAAGKKFDTKTTACTNCTIGKYQEENALATAVCKQCAVGTEWATTSTACGTCAIGKYQDQNTVDSASCKFCVAGKAFVDTSNACSECGSGQYQGQNTVASAVCSTCAAGQFVASATGTACGACETGKFQELEASIEYTCKFCVAGKAFVNTSNACSECGSGQYQDENNALSATCKFCAAGTEWATTSTACANCATGKYQEQNTLASAVCKPCETGRYSDTVGNSKCKSCQIGKFVLETGSNSSSDCDFLPCQNTDGDINNVDCYCGENLCEFNSNPRCMNGTCHYRNCLYRAGSKKVTHKCECGNTGMICSSEQFCFDPPKNRDLCETRTCGCSVQRTQDCDELNEGQNTGVAQTLITDPEGCACGNTICFENNYCNSKFDLCSTSPSSACKSTDGKTPNSESCLCGQKSVCDPGFFCNVEEQYVGDTINFIGTCSKMLCSDYEFITSLCDREGYANGVLPNNPTCTNNLCEFGNDEDFENCCAPCPAGNAKVNGKCSRECIGVTCDGIYDYPIDNFNYDSESYTGYCSGTECNVDVDQPNCCWEKPLCETFNVQQHCLDLKYTGERNENVTCDNYACTSEKCCATRECVCTNGIGHRGRKCPKEVFDAGDDMCESCNDNFWLFGHKCANVTTCNADEYQYLNYTSNFDRICFPMTPTCTSGHYESVTPSQKDGMFMNNRVCSPVSNCSDLQWQTSNATYVTDNQCSNLTRCNSSQYESVSPTIAVDTNGLEYYTSDRTCALLTVICDATHYESTAPTTAVDSSGVEYYISDRNCTLLSLGCNSSQYESVSPSISFDNVQYFTSDRTCAAKKNCSDWQFEVAPATNISNTVCQKRKNCGKNEFEINPGDFSRDRTCAFINVCTNREYQSIAPTSREDSLGVSYYISNRSCLPLTICNSPLYELVPPVEDAEYIYTTDRVCMPCNFTGCFGCKRLDDCYYNPSSKIHNETLCSSNTCTNINSTFQGHLKSGEWYKVSATSDIAGVTAITVPNVNSSVVFYIGTTHHDSSITIDGQQYGIVQDCEYARTWYECSSLCGSGFELGLRGEQIREALHGGKSCTNIPIKEYRPCNSTKECPVDCNYTLNQNFSKCTAPCGFNGLKYLKYTITQQAEHGGKKCPQYESAPCFTDPPEGFCDCNFNKYDVCNVCGGDGSSCLGCDGVHHSNKITDHCGKCVLPKNACSLSSIRKKRKEHRATSKTLKVVVVGGTGSTLFVIFLTLLITLCCKEKSRDKEKSRKKIAAQQTKNKREQNV